MKIIKNKKLTENIILSEDEKNNNIGVEDINPTTDSTKEIAQAIKNDVPELSGEEKVISDADAAKMADEVKNAAEITGASTLVLDPADFEAEFAENKLFRALERAYHNASRLIGADKKRTNANVLVAGLPGSGKTATVKAWCKKHNLVLVCWNATDSKLDASLNGMPMRNNAEGADPNSITYAYNMDMIEPLLYEKHPENENRCVLFVDELNRQISPQLRRPFMSVFNEQENAAGTFNFSKNLLFGIACINPVGVQYKDKGVAPLNMAEIDRFAQSFDFDSVKDDSLKFFNAWYNNHMKAYKICLPNSAISKRNNNYVGPIPETRQLSEEAIDDIVRISQIYDMGIYILSDEEFEFTDRENLSDTDRLVTARGLTDLIIQGDGDATEVLSVVDDSNVWSKRIKEMFHNVLEDYVRPTKEEIIDQLNLKGTNSTKGGAEPIEDEDAEDDDDLFINQSSNSSKKWNGQIDPEKALDRSVFTHIDRADSYMK